MAIILAIVCLGQYIPIEAKTALYAASLSIKSVIITALPFVIFGLLFKVASQLAHNATKVILCILAMVCCSNFISTFISHYVGIWIYHFDLQVLQPQNFVELQPLWSWQIPKLIANDKAMMAGLILGTFVSYFYPAFAARLAHFFEKNINKALQGFIYLIPLFVAGFVIKLHYDGAIGIILHDYSIIFAIILIAQLGYLLLVYFLSSNLHFLRFINSIRNMTPAAIAGFSTMSSATAMPLTILGAEKNASNPDLARSIIPATVNIHLVGDCFAIPILAYAVLKSYGLAEPAFLEYLIFAAYFVLAKFSVAAVPGGGILVMLPILESYLGFNSEMLSLITALYILFDPVITFANVLGNGALALVIDKLPFRFIRNNPENQPSLGQSY